MFFILLFFILFIIIFYKTYNVKHDRKSIKRKLTPIDFNCKKIKY